MWPFKKKKIEVKVDAPELVREKPKTYIVKTLEFREPIDFDIGYTEVLVNFLDGRSLITRVYGYYYPCHKYEQYDKNTKTFTHGFIGKYEFYDSSQMAKQLEKRYEWVDDPRNIKHKLYGEINEFTILDTHSYLEKVPNPILVEKELEVPSES